MDSILVESLHRLDNDSNLDLSIGNFADSSISKPPAPSPQVTSSYHHHCRSRPSLFDRRRSFLSPRASISSIDPEARHYRDPEARSKLRVVLASPQNFDQAVEFGFPLQEDEEEESPTKHYIFTHTVDDDDKKNNHDNGGRMSSTSTRKPALGHRARKSSTIFSPPPPSPPISPTGREMTLKMTLTRLDLRTTETTLSSPALITSPALTGTPPQPEDTTTADHIAGSSEEESSTMMKRFRRTCRKLGQKTWIPGGGNLTRS